MKSQLFKVYAFLGTVCLLFAAGANAGKPAKIDICHAPPGNPANTQFIQVGSNGSALPAHLLHGDWEVTAPKCDQKPDNDCDGVPDDTADNDADCDDGNPGTIDSCNTGVGECVHVNIEVACPCADVYTTAITNYTFASSPYSLPGGLIDGWDTCAVDGGSADQKTTGDGPAASTAQIWLGTTLNGDTPSCSATVALSTVGIPPIIWVYRPIIELGEAAEEQHAACVALQESICNTP